MPKPLSPVQPVASNGLASAPKVCFDEALAAAERAANETAEALAALEAAARSLELDPA